MDRRLRLLEGTVTLISHFCLSEHSSSSESKVSGVLVSVSTGRHGAAEIARAKIKVRLLSRYCNTRLSDKRLQAIQSLNFRPLCRDSCLFEYWKFETQTGAWSDCKEGLQCEVTSLKSPVCDFRSNWAAPTPFSIFMYNWCDAFFVQIFSLSTPI